MPEGGISFESSLVCSNQETEFWPGLGDVAHARR